MKKYFGFLVVASLMFSFSLASLVRAEDGGTGVSGSATVSTEAGTNDNQGMKTKPSYDVKTLKGARMMPQGDSTKRAEFKTEMQANRDAFRQKMETERKTFVDGLKAGKTAFLADLKAKKDEWKTANADKRAQFCANAKEIVAKRFQVAITALETFQVKVGDLIVQLKADGKDTTVAANALTLSKQKLDATKAKLAEIKGLVPDTCTNLTPEIWEKIKLGARDAKDLLKESREALHQSVKEIRSLKGEDTNDEHRDTDSNDDAQQ